MGDKEKDIKPKTGTMFKGQAWVELHGIFYLGELHAIVNEIEKNCKGLENKNGS